MLVNNLYTKYFAHFLYLIYNAIDNIEVNNYAIPIRHTRGWLSQNHCGRPDPMQTLAAANLLGYSGENQKQKPINNAEFPTEFRHRTRVDVRCRPLPDIHPDRLSFPQHDSYGESMVTPVNYTYSVAILMLSHNNISQAIFTPFLRCTHNVPPRPHVLLSPSVSGEFLG